MAGKKLPQNNLQVTLLSTVIITKKKKCFFKVPYAHLRYYLGGRRPSQTNARTFVSYKIKFYKHNSNTSD
jgi:hypothetical protein